MKNIAFLILFCFTANNLFAQSPAVVEADLLKTFKKINYWDECKSKDATAYDSLEKANFAFGNKLKYCTGKYPFTVNQKFMLLKRQGLNIDDSEDGLFRIYSWDKLTGGTMHFFENVFQYKTGVTSSSILDTAKGDGDNRPNYQKIFTLKTNYKTYYIATYLTIGSTKDISQGLQVFAIENGKLNNAVKLIKTKKGLRSELRYYYDFFSVVDWRVRPEIKFDKATQTLYLPMVDENYKMTHKFIIYKFNGNYFERAKM